MTEKDRMLKEKDIWIEKYRPKTIDDLICDSKIKNNLKSYIEDGNIPNLIFSGRAGTGKTASGLILGHSIFKEDDSFGANFVELNASDERGIDVIRTKIKSMADTMPINDYDFKIILLDEADALTKDAQNALKRPIEKASENCRFVFTCNYLSGLIEPLQSRCATFIFRPASLDDIKLLVDKVCKKEGIDQLSEDVIKAIFYVSKGDFRKSINLLQSAYNYEKEITEKTIYEVSSYINPNEIRDMIVLASKGKFLESCAELDNLLIDKGYTGKDIIDGISESIFDIGIPESIIASFSYALGETDTRISDGLNDRIHLRYLLSYVYLKSLKDPEKS